jgi:uncharacterized protein YbbK (DUF523 family)
VRPPRLLASSPLPGATDAPSPSSTPWQPEFCNWAFNLPRGQQLLDKWRRIPDDTDVLVSHTPPFGRGDQVGHTRVGCEDLLREVQGRVKPTLHVFGHVHEGYGRSSDGVTTFVNASACTHDYSPVNPPFVFDLDVPRSKKGVITTDSPLCADCDQDETGDDCGTCEDKALDYSRLLHEQLRVCSQKSPFVEQPAPPNGFVRIGNSPACPTDSCTDGKSSLRAFRVEGTTADLLFESTLRVRPVQHSQVRALRYLFSQGFRNNSSNYNDDPEVGAAAEEKQHGVTSTSTADVKKDAGGASKHDSHGVDEGEDAGDRRRQRRRQLAIARRVTVAVLNDLSESKEMSGPDREHLEQASIASESLIEEAANHNGTAEATAPASTARRRRDKTLRKRDGFTKLSTLVEEPAGVQSDATQSATTTSAVIEAVVVAESPAPPPAPTPAPSVDEDCVLCKYKVPGHVHPGREPSPSPVEVVMEAAPSVTAPKDKISDGDAESTSDSRSVTANKRLSSWF